MKKSKILALGGIVVTLSALTAGGLVACGKALPSGEQGGNQTNEFNDEYDWEFAKPFVGEKDADMTIDGVLDEARWNNKNWLYHREKDVDLRYTTVFTQKGLYIAAIAEDANMQWNDIRSFYNNSSFRFYIVSNVATQYYCFDCMSFYVDEKNCATRFQTPFDAKAVRSENEDGVPTLTAEFFATWEDLHYEVNSETGMPDYAKIVPMYRYVENFKSADNAFLKPVFMEIGGTTNEGRINNNLKFGKDGYINVDVEGAELGNAANGFAKSDGWDLTNILGDGEHGKSVRTTTEHGQAIFFKNIYSSRYVYSVDMKIHGGINDLYPSGGVCDMKSATEFNCLRIIGEDFLNEKDPSLTYHLLNFYVGGWEDTRYGNRILASNETDKINIKVIKDDTKYYYIFNGVYAFSKDIDWLGGKTCPGLYTLGCDAEYTNWQVTDLEGASKDAAFEEELNKYVYKIEISDSISGGAITTDRLAVLRTGEEKIKLSVKPTKGYILTDLKINGKSVYDTLVPEMVDGVIELTVNENLAIDATFTSLPLQNCVRVSGALKTKDGNPIINMPYEASGSGEHSELLYSSGLSTANGMFDIYLLREGTYTIGGREIKSTGVFDLYFDGVSRGYRSVSIRIDTKDDKFADPSYRMDDLVFESMNIGGSVKYSDGSVATSETDGWDLNGYERKELYAKHGAAGKRLYFAGNATEHAVINVTFNHSGTAPASVTAEQPMAGISMRAADGTYYSVMIFNDGVYLMPNAVWENNRFYKAENEPGYNLTDQKDADMSFTFVKTGDRVYVLYKKGTEWVKIFDVKDSRIDGEKAYSFMVNESADYDWSVAFKDYEIARSNDKAEIESTLKSYLGRTLTVGGDIAATVDGKPVSSGANNVMLGDTVTLTMPVTSGQNIAFMLGGEQIETVIKNNVATATFTVTDSVTVAYATAYEVSVSVTPNNAEITIVNESGKTIFSGNLGSEKMLLANGTYYATAVYNGKVSKATSFTVENAPAQVSLELDRSALDVVDGAIVYDRKTGDYKTNHEDTHNIGYFGTVAQGASFVLKTEMKGMSANTWPSAGLVIGTGTHNYVKFAVRYACEEGNYHYDLLLQGFNGGAKVESIFQFVDNEFTANIFSAGNAKVELVYNNGKYFVFINGKLQFELDENTVYGGGSIKDAVGTASQVKLGLFAERQISFVDWSESTARAELEQKIGVTVKFSDAGFNVTAGGVVVENNGKALLGDKIVVTKNVGSAAKQTFLVNGAVVSTTILNGVATAEFNASELKSADNNINITVSDAFDVSGTVVGGDENTSITIVDNDYNEVYKGTGATYKTTLTAGTYYVTAESASKFSDAAKIIVSGGDVTAQSVKLDKVKPEFITGSWNYDRKTGNFVSSGSVTDNRVLLGKVAQGTFAAELVIDGLFSNAERNEKYPCAGFRIQVAGENYLYFNLRYNDDSNIYQFWLKRWEFGEYKNIEKMLDFSDGSYLKTNPFKDGPVKLTLVYLSGTYYVYFNDALTFTLDENEKLNENGSIADAIGNGEREIVMFAERAAEVSNWSYTTDMSHYKKSITFTQSDITVKAGETPVQSGEKVNIGTDITLTKTVQTGETIVFYVNGTAINTTISNGVATATFKVVNDVTITASSVFSIAGSVTDGNDGTVVKIYDEKGAEVLSHTGKDFSVNVGNGTYYLSAEHDGMVSEVKKIEINDASALNQVLTMAKPKPQLVAGEFNYDFRTGSYSTPQSVADNQASIGHVAENTAFAVSTVVKDMSSADCPAVGFRVNVKSETEQYMFFRLRYDSNAGVYQCWLKRGEWLQYKNIEKLTTFNEGSWMRTTPFKENGQLKITLVYKDGVYYMLFNGDIAFVFDENGKLNDNGTISDALGSGQRELRLAAERAVTFVDWDFTTEAEKITALIGAEKHPALYEGNFQYNTDGSMSSLRDDVKNVAYFDKVSATEPFMVSADIKSIGSVDWPSAGLVVGTSRTNYIRFTIRHTCDSDPHYDLLLRGYKGELNNDTHKVERVFPFSDSSLTTDPFVNGTAKLSLYYKDNKYILFVNDKLQFAFDENAVYANGSIKEAVGATDKVMLGVFSEREASFNNFVSTTDVTTINNALGTKSIPAMSVGQFTYNNDGTVSTLHDDTNNLGYLGQVNKSGFTFEMSIKDMDSAEWPSVGMTIGVSNSQWIRFSVIRKTSDNDTPISAADQIFIFRVADQNGKEKTANLEGKKATDIFGSDLKGTLKVKLVRSEGKFEVYFNNDKVWEFEDTNAIGDTTVGAALGATDKVNLYLFAERAVTFTDWSYTQN